MVFLRIIIITICTTAIVPVKLHLVVEYRFIDNSPHQNKGGWCPMFSYVIKQHNIISKTSTELLNISCIICLFISSFNIEKLRKQLLEVLWSIAIYFILLCLIVSCTWHMTHVINKCPKYGIWLDLVPLPGGR